MSLFGKVLKTALDTALLPVDVAKDVVTMAGAMTEEDAPYTWQKFKKIGKDLEETRNEIDDL